MTRMPVGRRGTFAALGVLGALAGAAVTFSASAPVPYVTAATYALAAVPVLVLPWHWLRPGTGRYRR